MTLNTAACSVLVLASSAMLASCAGPGGRMSLLRSRDAAALARASAAPEAPTAGVEAADPAPQGAAGRSETLPTAAEIFDFRPAGREAGRWREPFIVSYTEGPLNAYRLKTLAELQRLRDHRYDLAPPPALAAR